MVRLALRRNHLLALSGFFLVLLLLCYRLPFSQLYRKMHNYNTLFKQVQEASRLRSHVSQKYFQSLERTPKPNIYQERMKKGNVTIAVGLITVKRSNKETEHLPPGTLDYLMQSASLVDHIMRHHAFFQTSVPFICNVDTFPESHKTAEKLYKFLPYTERYGLNSFGIGPLTFPGSKKLYQDVQSHVSRYHKETYDYAFCLQSAASLHPQYVILLEDDVLPHKDLPYVLEHMIHSRLNLTKSDHYKNGIAYLKMYYPAKWQGYATEWTRVFDLLSVSAVGAAVVLLISFILPAKLKSKIMCNESWKTFLISFLMVMLTCWLLGRQNINEFRRISKHLYRLQQSEGCCTQAMLYPIDVVAPLTQHLVTVSPHTHTDLAIMDYAAQGTLPALQIEPSLFFHVGLITSLNQRQKHPEEFIFHL
ncbi:post-GPI attachment to proteins factor 4 [Aplysia californica]|uniref:Post-GPI attachment to proteins factor 4 n=1 Tax=Aplysia californica TaxID=6500 RepID=A0ABM1A7A0_APLCA|nr:post-GPI attachment to proteins factor 4 [Aplysia californica]XP_012942220.1 post-GPI attachment to proteins factor 4 [Aplysia californica]